MLIKITRITLFLFSLALPFTLTASAVDVTGYGESDWVDSQWLAKQQAYQSAFYDIFRQIGLDTMFIRIQNEFVQRGGVNSYGVSESEFSSVLLQRFTSAVNIKNQEWDISQRDKSYRAGLMLVVDNVEVERMREHFEALKTKREIREKQLGRSLLVSYASSPYWGDEYSARSKATARACQQLGLQLVDSKVVQRDGQTTLVSEGLFKCELMGVVYQKNNLIVFVQEGF